MENDNAVLFHKRASNAVWIIGESASMGDSKCVHISGDRFHILALQAVNCVTWNVIHLFQAESEVI